MAVEVSTPIVPVEVIVPPVIGADVTMDVTVPVGVVASEPSPLIYCEVVPPGAKAWVWLVVVVEFVEDNVTLEGVPIVTVPVPVIVLKFIPFPLATDVTVPPDDVGIAL